jgi:hypothetical protein
MPREKNKTFDQVVRTARVRDAKLAAAAGEDDDAPSVGWSLAAFSERLREAWRGMSYEERERGLRAEMAARFFGRFGV